MLDLGPRWSPPPDWGKARIARAGLDLRPLAGLRQVMLSGDLAAGLAALCPGARPKGPHDPDPADPYAIRIAADRALLVTAGPLDAVPPGHSAWHEAGFALTDLSAAMIACAVGGPEAPALLARGTGVDLTAAPPATGGGAAILLAGARVLAYRHGEGLRLHVARSIAPHLWRWLDTAAAALS